MNKGMNKVGSLDIGTKGVTMNLLRRWAEFRCVGYLFF